jgi:steroid 5-alpha reductase family enzyme
MLATLTFILCAIGIFVTALFFVSILIKRNDIADVAWGIGVLIGGFLALFQYGAHPFALIVLTLGSLWGVRLSVRIFLRNRKKTEDARYRVWREEWGRWFYPRSYAQVYLLQGFLMLVVGYPLVHAVVYGAGEAIGIFTYVGILIWLTGFFFEVVGDYELDRYLEMKVKPTPVMQSGLWKYTRHPNYFGEVTMWWGIWLMIAPLPLSYIALIGPVTITVLILKVSGIPMLEKRFEGNADFEAYKARTSAFFPLPPKEVRE